MSSASSKSADSWLELDCPRCRARFRIKSIYAHMHGRCPNCGKRIEAPRPAPPPAATAPFDSEEPLGLVPIEEEWPEPGQMDLDDNPHYGFGAPPAQWAEAKAEKPLDIDIEGYGMEGPIERRHAMMDLFPEAYPASRGADATPLAGADATPLAPNKPPSLPPSSESIDEAYQVDLPVSTPPPESPPIIEEQKGPEKVPAPPPLPPAWPLWRGVYTFPWRLENLRVWVSLSLPLGALVYLASAFYLLLYVLKVLEGGFNPAAAFLVLLIPPMAIAGFVAALYGAAHFLAILEETAAGNDRYQQLGAVTDWVGSLLHLAYIGFCTFIPSVAIAEAGDAVFENRWGLLAGLIPALILFPLFLLSSMAGVSAMAILNGRVMAGFARKPLLFPLLFLASAAMAAICLGLGYLVFVTFSFILAIVAGFAWSACLMIYARLLGRVAWVLSQTGVRVKKRRKKKRKKVTPGPDDWGDEMGERGV